MNNKNIEIIGSSNDNPKTSCLFTIASNSSRFSLFEAKFGKSWQDTFDKEVNEERRKQKVIYDLLDNEKIILDKQKALEKEGNGLHYLFKKRNNGTYIVRVSGWGKIKGKDTYVSYFRYVVDIEKKQVKLTSDRVIKE